MKETQFNMRGFYQLLTKSYKRNCSTINHILCQFLWPSRKGNTSTEAPSGNSVNPFTLKACHACIEQYREFVWVGGLKITLV